MITWCQFSISIGRQRARAPWCEVPRSQRNTLGYKEALDLTVQRLSRMHKLVGTESSRSWQGTNRPNASGRRTPSALQSPRDSVELPGNFSATIFRHWCSKRRDVPGRDPGRGRKYRCPCPSARPPCVSRCERRAGAGAALYRPVVDGARWVRRSRQRACQSPAACQPFRYPHPPYTPWPRRRAPTRLNEPG